MADATYRNAEEDDISLILEFIKKLADYEGRLDEVTATELNTEVMMKSQPDAEILTTSGVERTHYAFGTQDKWSVYARVTGIRPRSNQVEITAVIEDDRVHQN